MAVRIAVIGTGFGVRIQAPAFQRCGRYEVVALVGRTPEKTAKLAARLDIPHAVTSIDDALALEVDAVSVATPPDTHRDYTVAAAAAGKHVLCEKPMARTLAEAQEMAAAVARAGVVGMIDHEFRFDPGRATLQRMIQQGDLGAPRLLTSIATSPLFVDPYRPPPAWWFAASTGGSWLGASGSHALDALRMWLGDVAAVTALLDAFHAGAGAPPPDRDADDTFSLLVRMQCGAEGVLQQTAAMWGPRLMVTRIGGSEGTAWIDDRWQLWHVGTSGEPALVTPPADLRLADVEPPPKSGPFARWEFPNFLRQAERFADAIEGREPGPGPAAATFADGVACQAVMEAARRAARERTWITL